MPETKTDRRSLAYTSLSGAPFVAVAAGLFLLRGAPGVLIASVLSLPWFAWRYDNESGAFFILTMLLIIVLFALVSLLMLMSLIL
jgi:hypothetical protein